MGAELTSRGRRGEEADADVTPGQEPDGMRHAWVPSAVVGTFLAAQVALALFVGQASIRVVTDFSLFMGDLSHFVLGAGIVAVALLVGGAITARTWRGQVTARTAMIAAAAALVLAGTGAALVTTSVVHSPMPRVVIPASSLG